MRYKLTILLLILTLSLKASDIGRAILTPIFIGTPLVIGYCHLWYDDFQNGNGLYVSPSLDAKMISEGLIDFKTRTFIKVDRWYPYLAWEVFNQPVNFEAWTIGCDYRIIDRRMWLSTGYETGCIYNQGKYVWTNAIGIEVGLITKYGYSITYRGDVQTRPELIGYQMFYSLPFVTRYNGRISLIIPLKTKRS